MSERLIVTKLELNTELMLHMQRGITMIIPADQAVCSSENTYL